MYRFITAPTSEALNTKTVRAWRDTWQHCGQQFDVKFFDDEACAAWVTEHYPQYTTQLKAYRWRIQPIDIIRLLWLWHWGGVYTDTDVSWNVNATAFDFDWTQPTLLWERCPNPLQTRLIDNGFMLFPQPRHPFLAHALRLASEPQRADHRSGRQAWDIAYSTGGILLRDALATFNADIDSGNGSNLVLLEYPEYKNFLVHHHQGSWWGARRK